MSTLICTTALVLFVAVAAAQTTSTAEGYSFKGNPLGMNLEQFKAANPTTPCFTSSEATAAMDYQLALSTSRNTADKKRLAIFPLQLNVSMAKGKDAKVAAKAALDTGTLDAKKAQDAFVALQSQGAPKDAPWTVVIAHKAGEITCSSSASMAVSHFSGLGDASPDVLKIGAATASGVVYQFLNGQLYKIVILSSVAMVKDLKDAFAAKYGEPTTAAPDDYQNGYGARWTGANFVWTHGSQGIILHEGSANGPAQERTNYDSSVTYEDHSLEPVPVKAATNF
jgi:hypothetical protein